MLSEQAKEKIESAVTAVAEEGYTFCGIAIHNDKAEMQPFSNLPTTAEFVYNLLSGAGLVAESIGADVNAIEAAQQNFQKQFIKINEA